MEELAMRLAKETVFQVEGRVIPEALVCESLVCTGNNEAEYARGGAVTQSQVMEGLLGHYKDFS